MVFKKREGRDFVQTIFEQLSILYVFLLAGWLIGKKKKEKADHADILSVLLVNILLPCKVFSTFANNFSPAYFAENYILPLSALVLLVHVLLPLILMILI